MLRNVLIFFIILFISAKICAAEKIAVVVNKKNNLNSITSKNLKNFFLGKVKCWSDGKICKTANHQNISKLRFSFRKIILKMTMIEEKKYWTDFLISGKGSHNIPEFSDSATIIKFVENNIEAIGYIKESELDKSKVKVLKIDDIDISDKDYKLLITEQKQAELY